MFSGLRENLSLRHSGLLKANTLGVRERNEDYDPILVFMGIVVPTLGTHGLVL